MRFPQECGGIDREDRSVYEEPKDLIPRQSAIGV